MLRLKNLVLVFAVGGFLAPVFAGDWSSGGGNGVILPDDTVVLSDPYRQQQGQPGRAQSDAHTGIAQRWEDVFALMGRQCTSFLIVHKTTNTSPRF